MDVKETLALAAKYHKDSKPYGIFPYTHHLESVRALAAVFNYNHLIQKACLLHDTIEDTDATQASLLADGVDPQVIEMVWAVTDGTEGNRAAKKAVMYEKLKSSPCAEGALVVKTCDRIINVQFSLAHNRQYLSMYKKEHDDFVHHLSQVSGFGDTKFQQLFNLYKVLMLNV